MYICRDCGQAYEEDEMLVDDSPVGEYLVETVYEEIGSCPHCGGGGFKAQMKKADASGAQFAVIIGDDEANAGEVTLKPLRADGDERNEQKRVSVDHVADEIMNSFMDWEEE